MRFSNKVAVVTGGGSGIGRATCLLFASEGAHVLVVDLSPERGNQTVAEICAKGGDAVFAKADVSNSADVQAALKIALGHWSKIDVVVNDAAMMTFDHVVDLDEHAWDHVLAVNLKSVFLFAKYSIPHMPPGSSIVNISSIHAHASEPGVAPYAASKGGMEAFIRVLSRECKDRKIRVNCVAPGAINTPMLWNNPEVKQGLEKITGAVGEPEDVAAAICFLASADAKFINGTTLMVDGGRLDILP